MRILQVVPFFSQAKGGSVVVPYQLSKHLQKRGHEVSVFTTDHQIGNEYAQSLDGVDVVPFHCVADIGGMLISPSMKSRLKTEMKDFDVVHMHNFRSYQNMIVHRYARKSQTPYVLQAHGSLPRIIEKGRLKRLFDSLFGYRILRNASKLIAVSRVEVRQYGQFGIDKDRIVRIPNGLDIDRFRVLPERGEFRERYGIREKHMVLFLGRIHRIKGLDFLVKAFASLTKGRKDIALVIAGPDDGYKGDLIGLMKSLNLGDEVKFVGYLDNPLSAYVDADVLVCPAAYEIFGLVPFEAMMCGTQVIVTDDCGCGEIMKEANAGYLVRYGDEDSLIEKIAASLDEPSRGHQMVEGGKRYIHKNLTWHKIVETMERLYGSCVDV